MIKTPGGRFLGGRADSPDPRDKRFEFTHMRRATALPPSVDLSSHLPPAWDQGQEGSCGANAGSALMCFLKGVTAPYSRQQIYYDCRLLENQPIAQDNGVETRDVLKVLQQTGALPETQWPYTQADFAVAPPVEPAADYARLEGYSRLVTETEYISCLAQGFPFLLGFECFESIDSDALARTGVMPMPDPKKEQDVGGHDVLVCGYDIKFKSSAVFKASGLDPSQVGDEALLIRNSWGIDWGIKGYFWMPLLYATNPSIGGDAWTGRLS